MKNWNLEYHSHPNSKPTQKSIPTKSTLCWILHYINKQQPLDQSHCHSHNCHLTEKNNVFEAQKYLKELL